MSTALKTVGTDVAEKPKRDLVALLEDPKLKDAMGVLAGKYMTGDRMLKLCLNAIRKTPKLLQCDPKSVLGAFMTSAALGLEPNTVQQQAFLIPYKKRVKIGNVWEDGFECQFQIGYRGFVTLAYRSPLIASLQSEAIHAGDKFECQLGSETFCRYSKALNARGALVGAFCFTKMHGGSEQVTVLPLDELHKIRSRSETYRSLTREVQIAETEKDRKKAEDKLAETPWVLWEDDMAAKSTIKKHAKKLPLAPEDRLAAAGQIDDQSAIGALDLSQLSDPDYARAVIDGEEELPALTEHAGGEPTPTVRMPEKKVTVAAHQSATRASTEGSSSLESSGAHGAADLIEYTFIDEDGALMEEKSKHAKLAVNGAVKISGLDFHIMEIDETTNFVVVTPIEPVQQETQAQTEVFASAGMVKAIKSAMDREKVTEERLRGKFAFDSDHIPASQVTNVLGFIKNANNK